MKALPAEGSAALFCELQENTGAETRAGCRYDGMATAATMASLGPDDEQRAKEQVTFGSHFKPAQRLPLTC